MQEQRIIKLRKKLTDLNLDSFLVSNFYNILYLTDFKTLTTDEREAFVLVTKNNAYLFTDERYVDQNLKSQISNSKFELKLIEPNKGLVSHLREIGEEEKLKTIGFEAEDLRFFEHDNLTKNLPKIKFVANKILINRQREIKDDTEIEKIKKACEITDECLRYITSIIKREQSEKEIAFKIEMWIKEKGHDLAFDPIVAVDANASVPHYNTKAGEGIVKDGSLILVDFGVKYNDYLSDVTRMFFLGNRKDEVMNAYSVLQKVQGKTIEEISNLASLSSADEYCRKIIGEKKFSTYPHSTGHGVGLQIHEYPKLSFYSHDQKQENQVFTVEPGIYIPGKWGMRVEDTVYIKDGMAVRLTRYSSEIIII